MKYVIIGGDAAGMSAAMQIVRNVENAKVTTLEMGDTYSYAQCGLPYAISGRIPKLDSLIARTRDTFEEKYGIDARIFHKVEHVDEKAKLVSGTNLKTNETFSVPYDKLLVATGARPLVPDWDGVNLKGVHTLKTIADAKAIMESATDAKNVTVIGGGYIGLEMAEAFHELGKDVRIIQRGAQLANTFDLDMAEHINDEAEKQGIAVHLEESVTALNGNGVVTEVITDKTSYETDLVLIAIGVIPNTELLDGTGVHKGVKGAIQVNRYMETNVKDIYAAGDCATQYHRVKEKDDFSPLGTHANKQGRLAGLNMIKKTRPFQGMVGTAILKFCDLSLGRTGLTENEAKELNLPYETTILTSTNIAGYYPGKEKLHVKLLYRSDTKQLLGGQFVGIAGVAKRTDVIATALFHRMKIDELEDLDLSYAPPFNSVWDPVQQGARRSK
ncbi:CoA-disulfide reductase [Lottiidibacillus patelloidae]|uniref:CoA-disulfide reductase n=1 Tax=Lottiidibacillus patelloidae TaxID=2670334 RepID=A0A263BSS4_9BACI|nr:CoA-disulfide reductase [Lottiidibacillus patelloidae]OZM56770.1 CoA-disulfide reductase [Lottiidibacillus patelloidae]